MTKVNEVFATVPEFPKYQISTLGRVRRSDNLSPIKPIHEYNRNGKIRAARVFLGNDKKITRFRIHSLVMSIFNPNPDPDRYTSIDHIDRNPLNNRLSNLRWADSKMQSNNRDNPRKTFIKLTVRDLDMIYHRTKKETLSMISKDYGISKSRLSFLLIIMHPEY